MKKIIMAVFMLSIATSVYASGAKTRTINMREDMRTLLFDDAGATYTDPICLRILNMNQRWFASIKGIGKVDTILSVNDQIEYVLPADFISTDKVTIGIAGQNRHKALDRRAFARKEASEPTLGSDGDNPHTLRYNVIHGADSTGHGYYLQVDPAEALATEDTFFVYYAAEATDLTGDSTLTNIPYWGVDLVVLRSVMFGLWMNRENPTTALILPYIQKEFDRIYALHFTDRSAPIFKAGQ